MATHAQRLMVVADGSKIGRVTLAKVADAPAIDDLVTDTSADPDELARIAAHGTNIHVVQAGTATNSPSAGAVHRPVWPVEQQDDDHCG
jgi:hypothetical protein